MWTHLGRTTSLVALALPLALACGDDGVTVSASDGTSSGASTSTGEDTTTTGGGTTTTTTGTTATSSTGAETTSGTTTASTTATTGPTTTTTTSTSTDTTTTTSTSTTTDSSTSEGSTTGEEEGLYAARYFAGGLDRIMIRKAELMNDRCTHLQLVWPGEGLTNQYDPIDRPTEWGIERAWIAEGADGCLEWGDPDPPQVEGNAGAGVVTWESEEPWTCPEVLDIEVTLDFISGDLPWVPPKVHLSAQGLPVTGCM